MAALARAKEQLTDASASMVEVAADELEKKHMELIASYADDLHTVQHLFMENRNTPPIAHNLPPIAGALTWCRGLLERVRQPMDKLRELDIAVSVEFAALLKPRPRLAHSLARARSMCQVRRISSSARSAEP